MSRILRLLCVVKSLPQILYPLNMASLASSACSATGDLLPVVVLKFTL